MFKAYAFMVALVLLVVAPTAYFVYRTLTDVAAVLH
jgi:hypothetical protein